MIISPCFQRAARILPSSLHLVPVYGYGIKSVLYTEYEEVFVESTSYHTYGLAQWDHALSLYCLHKSKFDIFLAVAFMDETRETNYR